MQPRAKKIVRVSLAGLFLLSLCVAGYFSVPRQPDAEPVSGVPDASSPAECGETVSAARAYGALPEKTALSPELLMRRAFDRPLPGHAASALEGSPVLHRAEAVSAPESGERRCDVRRFSSTAMKFSLHKRGTGQGPTLLVVGGIQGDEPGGFSAAALLASRYAILAGSVWVVPDLNFAGILQRNRGPFGDMNRKFAALAEADPEYPIVEGIKTVLLDDAVDLVLNLHDGSGFYRPTKIDALRNPARWGQSIIIDQEEAPARNYGQLLRLAESAAADANKALVKPEHRYHIRNTHTGRGDREMEKSLSWFAVRQGKPAFGVEASKELSAEVRCYYHLQIIESFMKRMGIAFERDFPLTPAGVLAALNSDLVVAAYDDKLVLPLDDVRPTLGVVPFHKEREPEAKASKPLLALVREKNDWRVAYGNRTLTRLQPAFMDFDDSLSGLDMIVDGAPVRVPLGTLVPVGKSFQVVKQAGYRVNAIGAQRESNGTEAGVDLRFGDFMPRFSVDKGAGTYRVEVYKGNAFAGMVLVRFAEAPKSRRLPADPLTARKGPESALGF